MQDQLTSEERVTLLELARQALQSAVHGDPLPPLDMQALPPRLLEPGVTFVTLTIGGELRGCIGALEPYMPLVEDVREHAVAAALQDFRFLPVQPAELPEIKIEISRLTSPQVLDYESPEDLLLRLKPGEDGVIIKDGVRRATFLPQVWQKLPAPDDFLSHLCQKMGAPPYLWRDRKLEVQVYQVEEFHE
jgi:AmmeMemoRadiSam system protein A